MTALFDNSAAKLAKKQAAQAQIDEANRQNAITSGTQAIDNTFGQFNDDFYNGISKGYSDYATPQLQQQYDQAKKALTYSLDRSGNLDSSTRAQQEGQLQKQYDAANQGIADQALSYSNQSRGSIENSRANLIATLNANGNAQAAASNAINQATSLSAPPTFSALGQIFGDVTSAAATQAQIEKNNALFGSPATYSTGLFSTPKSAVVNS